VLCGRGIPIVFTSGYDVQTVFPAAFEGTRALSKPFSMEVLEKALRRAVTESPPARRK
jgi:CheY-like chemotaxis protein